MNFKLKARVNRSYGDEHHSVMCNSSLIFCLKDQSHGIAISPRDVAQLPF
jgi:hypothetical protein